MDEKCIKHKDVLLQREYIGNGKDQYFCPKCREESPLLNSLKLLAIDKTKEVENDLIHTLANR
jgi:hypothetical protein